MSKPKPKSVDEAYVLECAPDGQFRPRVIHEEKSALKDLACPYEKIKPRHRIRKWRAETVCEVTMDRSGFSLFYISSCGRVVGTKDKFCCGCGGKIRVRK